MTSSRKLILALGAASASSGAYLQWGNDVLLGVASTALALAAFWVSKPWGLSGSLR